ncbi:MAG: hypothetical protein E6K36_02970 [Gammaproteobacteria bacterium]|nr:MAG: hypothetical protein E6K36_02970 [Gammaproteobacteria bacterium]
MKMQRLRALAVCIAALMAYALFFNGTLERRFAGHSEVFLVCAAVIIVLTGLVFEPRRAALRISWAALSPLVASVLAYLAVQAVIYAERGYSTRGVSFSSWAFAATVLSYFASGIWVLSIALLALSTINHLLGSRPVVRK